MELSSTTLIGAINKVLENIGERRIRDLSSPVSRKCFEALRDTVYDIASLHDWEWLKENILATSWTNEKADLGDVQRIHSLSVGDSVYGYRPVPYETPASFDMRPLLPYGDNFGRPRTFTIETYNVVRVNPYPVSAEGQSKYRFYVTREMIPPSTLDGRFPLPERVMPLVYYRASHMMCVNHLDDPQAAQQYLGQFQDLVMRLRDRERSQPSGGQNMFKLRR